MYWSAWWAVFTSLHNGIFGVLKTMFGANVQFKCNYASLRKSSDIQQQDLLLGQRWIIWNTMWIWLATSSQRRIFYLWNMVYQDFGKFNTLKNTLTDSRSNTSLSLCMLLMSNTYTCTHRNTTKKLATFDIAIQNRRYIPSYLLRFQFHI